MNQSATAEHTSVLNMTQNFWTGSYVSGEETAYFSMIVSRNKWILLSFYCQDMTSVAIKKKNTSTEMTGKREVLIWLWEVCKKDKW